MLGNCPDQARPECAAQVTGHCQKREQCGTTLGQAGRYDADGAGPHDAYGESTENAPDQAQGRAGRQGCQQIAAQAQDSGTDHIPIQIKDAVFLKPLILQGISPVQC